MITPVDTVRYYQDLIEYISDKIGIPVEMVYRKTYDEMDIMLEEGSVDAAFICATPYIADRRKFGVELLVAPQVGGSVFYKSYIIVHKNSDIGSLERLRGKKFAFTDPKSNSGKLYAVYRLAMRGERPEDFFQKYVYSYSHNKSIELVAKKVVDGAAVESLIYEYLQKKASPLIAQTKIVEKSPDFGSPPMVVSPKVSAFVKEKLREILTGMHADQRGKKILDSMLIDQFVEVPDEHYDSIREMESFVDAFNAKQNRALPVDGRNNRREVVHFGLVPKDNPRIAYEKYQPIMDYLSAKTSYRFELVLPKTYGETVRALGNGDIDFAFLGPLTYLHARAEFGAIPILRSISDKGSPYYRSVIITRENQPIRDIHDLKGKKFAFASLQSTSGNLIPRFLLAQKGIHLIEFGSYSSFNYHDSIVKWVLKGQYDAGAVRESVAEKYLPLGLVVIATSEPIPTGPVVAGPRTPLGMVEAVKKSLLEMLHTPLGRETLVRVDSEMRGGFMTAEDGDYEDIRKMINAVPKTCGAGCHPKIRL